MLTARGKQYTRRGEFVDAAADFDKAIQLDPTNHWNYYYRACLAAYLGQRDVYRKTCTAMFQQFSADTNAQIRDRTTKTCSLLENSGVDPKDLLKAAESLPPDGGGSPDLHAWFSLCHALALYRNGQYSQCLQTVQGAMSPQRLPRLPTAQLLEVMARWHTAPTADTYTELRQITDRTDHELPRPTVDDLGQGLNIEDWLICQIVRRQAENLIRR